MAVKRRINSRERCFRVSSGDNVGYRTKQKYRKGKLTDEQISRLKELRIILN